MNTLGSQEWFTNSKRLPFTLPSTACVLLISTMAIRFAFLARRRASLTEIRSPANSPIFLRAGMRPSVNKPRPWIELLLNISKNQCNRESGNTSGYGAAAGFCYTALDFVMRASPMTERLHHLGYPIYLLMLSAVAAYAVLRLPGYLTNPGFLGSLVFLQIIVVMLWRFEVRFFPFLMFIFLMAGADVPWLHSPAAAARWTVLAVGAVGGLILYLRRKPFGLGVFHLWAGFAVLAALVSAWESAYTQVSILKAISLLLLCLYGSFGARLAVSRREEAFFATVLLGGEILTYASAVLFFGLRISWLGNPNSLGAAMSIFAVPLLFWGVLEAKKPSTRRQLVFALGLAWALLLSSYARAGIVAGLMATLFLCAGRREYKMLAKLLAFVVVAALMVANFFPRYVSNGSSLMGFVYKQGESRGVLGSRKSPWEKTVQSVQEHPWLGTGFGTSDTSNSGESGTQLSAPTTETAAGGREHGNSYLEILEWVGILGVVPFAALIILLLANVGIVFRKMRTGSVLAAPASLLGAFVLAGLTHAFFEDWLFAPGSYLCVFFWAMAYILQDFVPGRDAVSNKFPGMYSPFRPT